MNGRVFIDVDIVFTAMWNCFLQVISWLQHYGIEVTIGSQAFRITFFDAALTFAFLCFAYMLIFPHFFYEDAESELGE